MSSKHILFDEEARARVLRGITALAAAVKVTLGPKGRNVLIGETYGPPRITKDGVTVARSISLPDPDENLGAEMAREVAVKTAAQAGDGTTAAVVLAEALYREGLRCVVGGLNPLLVKRGIDRAVEVAVSELAALARKVTGRADIFHVAQVAANWDPAVAEIITEAIERVGRHGTVVVEAAATVASSLQVVEGTRFDQGYISPYFITDPDTMESVLEEAHVLVHEGKIARLAGLLPLLQTIAPEGKPLLIVAEAVEGEALATLVVNHLRGVVRVCAVKAPGFGEERKAFLDDLALLTGSRFFSGELGARLENVQLNELGRARRIVVGQEQTTIVEGGGDPKLIRERIQLLRSQLDPCDDDQKRTRLEARLAKLSGGVGVIRVGAATEVELKQRKDQIDDALQATRAAIDEGIVPGGGVALLRVLPALERWIETLEGDEKVGARVVRRALEEPIRQLCANAGVDASLVVGTVERESGDFGYNVANGSFENLFDAGIIDPAKVVRCALQNAASVAGLMLNTEAVITHTAETLPRAA